MKRSGIPLEILNACDANNRTKKSLHLTWRKWAKEIIASYEWYKCLFLTCTLVELIKECIDTNCDLLWS